MYVQYRWAVILHVKKTKQKKQLVSFLHRSGNEANTQLASFMYRSGNKANPKLTSALLSTVRCPALPVVEGVLQR